MNKRRFLIFGCLLLVVLTLSWGIDQGWGQPQNANSNGNAYQNQLKEAENAAAALRAEKGLQRSVTNAQRQAAAARAAARRAEAAAPRAEGVTK